MSTFDTRSAYLIVGLLYLILPAFTWFALAAQRSRQINLWCGGGLLIGAAIVFYGSTGYGPHGFGGYVLQLLFSVSGFMRIQSLRIDLGRPWQFRWMALAVLGLFLVYLWSDLGPQRAKYSSVLVAGLLLYLAVLAWRIGRDEQSDNARWIAIVYGLVATSLLFRAYSLQTVPLVPTAGSSDQLNQLMVLAILLSSVVGHFCYVGLALDRSRQRELKAATERVREEEGQRLGQQIAHLDRQRSLGEMAASLGHELNQPLATILTNVQVATRGLQSGHFDSAKAIEFLDKIGLNTKRASQIIDRIRGFIQPSVSRSEPVDLNTVVKEVADLVADTAHSHKVSIIFAAENQSVLVTGDPIELSQIVLNVLRNAIEALTQVARREIHVSCTRLDGRAVVVVRDTGWGFTPEALARDGAPFFTTKISGLGLGLSISRSIALQHGGTLTLTNAPVGGDGGSGAVVTLNLPALPPTL